MEQENNTEVVAEPTTLTDAGSSLDVTTPTPAVPLISYADFAKLQIKIGTIMTAEFVPDADKLLRLTVDVGEEAPRQIVSGIRQWFPEPDVLVGKQCPFLVNLEPRIIRGLESQGMILAIGNDEEFSLLHPSVPVTTGVVVR
jgi:methionyl-tRNA synthetase